MKHLHGAALLALSLLLAALAACDTGGSQQQADAPAAATSNEPVTGEAALHEQQERLRQAADRSLIDPKTELGAVPVAWSLSYDGSSLLGFVNVPSPHQNIVCRWDLRESGKPRLQRLLETEDGLRAYITARHDGTQALVAGFQQLKSGYPADAYYLTPGSSEQLELIQHINARHLPAALPPDALDLRPAFFSLDSRYMIVPVGVLGVIVVDTQSKAASYLPLPDFGEFTPQGINCGVLPALDGAQYVFISQYAALRGTAVEAGGLVQSDADFCQLSILNLATLKFEESRRFNWLVIELGTEDFRSKTWRLLGSRLKTVNTEMERMAKAARLDPATGLELLEPYLSGLGWDAFGGMRVTPDGARLVYKDYLQRSVLRINLADGSREIDRTNYLHDGGLLIDNTGETVLMVQDNVALRCEFEPLAASAD